MASKKFKPITLTFSKKNSDVHDIVSKMEESDPTFVKTDYFCEAVRFFEQYKDSMGTVNHDSIKRLIDARLEEKISELKTLLQSGEEAADTTVNPNVNSVAHLEDESIELLNEDED